MKLDILTDPNHDLRLRSEEINKKELAKDETQTLIDNMIETMKSADGVGLAAPQIGVHKKIIIVETKSGPEVFINPRITSRSLWHVTSEEGCLSIPGVYGQVKRNKKVTVKALDRHGHKIRRKVSGMEAIIFQHEIDHLNGILFIDRVINFTNPPKL